MNVFWLAPLAWTGLALLVVPIVIHLLARQHSRRVLFPTLRFLPASRLAALRRRAIADWPLLIIRMLIVAAAVAAAAGPVFVSDARRAAWDARIARAIVVSGETPQITALVEDETQASFVSAAFNAPRLPDAVRAAVAWLNTQPPAAREVVIIGDLRDGDLAAADVEMIPAHAGVRFLPVPASAPARANLVAMSDVGGRAARLQVIIEPDTAKTHAKYAAADGAELASQIRLVAAATEQGYADALLRAVLREGVLFDPATPRAVTIAFEEATDTPSVSEAPDAAWMQQVLERHPEVRGGDHEGTLVLRASMPVTDARAPALVAGVLRTALTPSLSDLEPRPMPAAQLARWSRPAGSMPPDVRPADEGDRRWFWGAALLLLALEQVVRRRVRHA